MTLELLSLPLVARNIAITAHAKAGNTYGYGLDGERLPYYVHLNDVVSVLMSHGIQGEIILSAAWLHDVLEDTGMTKEELVDALTAQCDLIRPQYIDTPSGGLGVDSWNRWDAKRIVSIVELLTNPAEGNRAEKHAISYPKIASNTAAITVKIADRIANMSSGGKASMYLKEHPYFFATLFRKKYEHSTEEIQRLWDTYLSTIDKLNAQRLKA